MDILCLGQQNWDHCWTGKQQLTSRLAERGHRVLYLDPDVATRGQAAEIRRASLRGAPGLRHRGPGDLWTYTFLPFSGPRLPAIGSPSGTRARATAAAVKLRQAYGTPSVLAKLGFHAPVALCMHPSHILNLRRANPQAIVYYAVDEYTAYGGMRDASRQRTRAREDWILARADVALAVSPTLRDRFAPACFASYVLENGSDFDHFQPDRLARMAPHPALADLEGPVVGFIGQVDSRLDIDLVAAIAQRHPDWTLAFAGRQKGVDIAPLGAHPNVLFLGYQPYEALPSIAKRVDLWIVPYLENELTHACNPLKVYEYLATGRPVVSRPLEGLVTCRDVIRLAREHDAFIAAIEAGLADPAAGRLERLRRAEENDWYARVVTLEDHFEEAVRRSRDRGRWLKSMSPPPRVGRLSRGADSARGTDEYGRRRIDRRAAFAGFRIANAALRLLGIAMRPPGIGRRRILVAWRGWLGDFVLIEPMIAHLRRQYPRAKIAIGAHRTTVAKVLFANSPDVDEVVNADFVTGEEVPLRERVRRLADLVGRRFDTAVIGHAVLFRHEGLLSGARRAFCVYDGHALQALQGRGVRRDIARHQAENCLALAEAMTGAVAAQRERLPRLHLDEAEVADKRAALIETLSLGTEAPVLVVHPGSKRATRRWPAERLADTVARVLRRKPDLVAVFTGSDGERPLVADVLTRLPAEVMGRVRDAAGRTDIAGLVGLLDRSDGVLCNDTGIMHLARARGTPLVATLGPENHRLWGPYPEGDAPAYAVRREVPCAPCIKESCSPHYCLRSVAVDAVEQSVLSMLDGGRSPEGDGGRLRLDLSRLSWSALKREGFDLPTVSVIVASPDGEALSRVLPVIERQTYPNIEVVFACTDGAAWIDDRDEERRRTLPIRSIRAPHPVSAWRVAVAAAAGELVVGADPEFEWRPSRLALDVAGAMRSQDEDAFVDGRPLAPGAGQVGATLRRSAALAQAGGLPPDREPPKPRAPGGHEGPRDPGSRPREVSLAGGPR